MPSCDYVDRSLLVVKATFFFFFSGMSCIAPFMGVYMRQLGLLPSETGVIAATKNFVSVLIKPLLGSIADKTGRPKVVAVLTVLAASTLHFSLLFVPPVPSTATPKASQGHGNLTAGGKGDNGGTQPWTSLTFWLVFGITFIAHGFQWSSVSQVEAATYQIIKRNQRGVFGHQRLWGSVGFALFALISSVAMDTFTDRTSPDNPGNKTDYSVTFYMFLAFMLVSVICLLILEDWSTGPSIAFMKGMGKLLSQLHLAIFLLAVLLLGAYDGAGESFLFWHLKDLGASQTVLGASAFVKTVAEIPLYVMSGWIIEKLGHVLALQISFITFGLNFLGYSIIRNPWWAVLVGVMNGYSAVTWATATSYASISAQGDLQSVAQGIVAATFYGLGHGSGNLISGPVFHRYGAVVLFRSLAVCCLVGLLLFYVLFRCFGKNSADPTAQGSDTRQEEEIKRPMLKSAADLPKPDAFLRGGSITSGAGEPMGSLRIVKPQTH